MDKWAHLAGRYEEAYGPKANSPCRPLASALSSDVEGRVLDLACGPGYELALFPRGVGIDNSPAMLREARRRAPGAGLVRGDIRRLPFRPGSFAAAYSCLALIHLTKADCLLALLDCAAVLQPGGRFFAVFFAGAGERVTGFSPLDPSAVEQYSYYRGRELSDMAAAAGFVEVSVEAAVLDEPDHPGISCLSLAGRAARS